MGLVLDATVSGTSSNAYATYASVTDILLMDIHKTATWASLSTSDAEASIIFATSLLDSQINWIGTRGSTTQKLRWPRDYAVDPDGNSIDNTIIPLVIQQGTSFFAYALSQDQRTAESDTYGFKSLKAGSLAMVIDKYDRKPVMPNVVWDLLRFYGTKITSATRVLERR